LKSALSSKATRIAFSRLYGANVDCPVRLYWQFAAPKVVWVQAGSWA